MLRSSSPLPRVLRSPCCRGGHGKRHIPTCERVIRNSLSVLTDYPERVVDRRLFWYRASPGRAGNGSRDDRPASRPVGVSPSPREPPAPGPSTLKDLCRLDGQYGAAARPSPARPPSASSSQPLPHDHNFTVWTTHLWLPVARRHRGRLRHAARIPTKGRGRLRLFLNRGC